jgi:hypothetical protein
MAIPKTALGDIMIVPAENETSLGRPEATPQNVVKGI